MKKLVSLVLTVAMLVTLSIPTFASAKAAPKLSLEDAIKTAKAALNLNTDNYNFSYTYNEGDNNGGWQFNWASKKSNGNSISATVDSESGEITNYYESENIAAVRTTQRIPKYSKNEARDAAAKFLKNIVPEKFKQTVEKNNPKIYYDNLIQINSDTYDFNYMRQANSIDFPDNNITISVDKNTLEIRRYTLNWDKGSIPDASKAITIDKAKDVFAQKLGLELAYSLNYSTPTPQAILVYRLKDSHSMIDALTGDVLKNEGRMYAAEKAAAASKADMANGVSLSPQEQASVDDSGKYISKDAAIEIAKKYVNLDSNFKLTSSNFYKNDNDKSGQWNLNWNQSSKSSYSYASATVDAVNSKILSFSTYGDAFNPDKNQAIAYTKDKAQSIAEDFIKGLEPDKFKQTVLKTASEDTSSSSIKQNDTFYYTGKINGAVCDFDNFRVEVSPYTGKVMSYSCEWSNVKLPSTDGIMTLDNAYKSLYSIANFGLSYEEYSSLDNGLYMNPEVKLVYEINDLQGMLDAKSGAQIDYSGNPIVIKKPVQFNDIKGNISENDIQTLIDLGIIDDTSSSFNPNVPVLQKDFIKLLVKALPNNYMYYGTSLDQKSSYDNYYNTAIQMKILTEAQKAPDSKVTRKDAASYIVKALGLGFIASNNNIYKPLYKDAKSIDAKYIGVAAISSALNLLPSPDNRFKGDSFLTKGLSASTIVNYLKVDTSASK